MPRRVNICAVRCKTAEDDAVLWMRIDAKRPNLDCAPIAFGVGSGIAGRLLLADHDGMAYSPSAHQPRNTAGDRPACRGSRSRARAASERTSLPPRPPPAV